MSIRVLVNGSQGRMGQEAVKAIQQDHELILVAQAGKNDDLMAVIQASAAQIVVDLTTAEVAFKNASTIVQAGVHPVIGTSGLSEPEIKHLQQICAEKKLGGIVAPNFCIGAILAMQFAREAAKFFNDVEIIEMHHAAKLDSPSGTAIKTAEMIAETRIHKIPAPMKRETIPGARGALSHGIPIHAVRLPGGIVAKEEILFGAPGEMFSIQHTTTHREAFMPGIRLACKKVLQLNHLIYGLEHIL